MVSSTIDWHNNLHISSSLLSFGRFHSEILIIDKHNNASHSILLSTILKPPKSLRAGMAEIYYDTNQFFTKPRQTIVDAIHFTY